MLHQYDDFGLLVLRLVIGTIFLVHGIPKLKKWKVKPSKEVPAGMLSIMRTLSIVEPTAGIAVILGIATPVAAAVLGIVMLGAIWMKVAKWHVPFSAHDKVGWEFDLLILASCLVLIFQGAGSIALDPVLFTF